MATIQVDIQQHGSHVDTRSRELRRTPDGRLGVIFQGLVYPLLHNRQIELAGRWFYPADCPIVNELPPDFGLDLDEREERPWRLETGGYFTYVMLNGSSEVASTAVERLNSRGFPVSRFGPSFRPAEDGAKYDWFIRLEQNQTRLPSGWEISEALHGIWALEDRSNKGSSEVATLDLAEPSALHLELAMGQLSAAEDRLATTERELAVNEEELANAKQALHRLKESSTRDQAKLADQIAFLRAALSEYRLQLDQIRSGDRDAADELARLNESVISLSDERTELTRRLRIAEDQIRAATNEWLNADKNAEKARAETAALMGRLEDLESALTDTRTKLAQSVETSKKRDRGRKAQLAELTTILEIVLPRFDFVGGSLEFMSREISDLRNLLACLRQLETNPSALESKRVRGTKDWLERHFNTGQSNDGRLYFKKADRGNTARYQILVSDKADQAKDIERLKSL